MIDIRFPRRTVLVLSVLLIVNLIGCAPGTTEVSSAAPPSPTTALTETSVPTAIPTATQTPFVPKAIIRIVSQSPASTDIARGAELAVDQLVGPLAELGYKVEFIPYDDQASIDVGVANAKKIVEDPQVLCGVGHYNSRVMINASDIYHLAGLAFVSPSNTAPKVTDRGYLEVNRLVGRDDGQGAAGAKFAQAQRLTSVFVVRNNNDFSNRNADAFKREANELGLKVVGDFRASVEAGNYEAVITHLMSANADMVYFSGTADQAGPFFKQARLAGYTGTFLGIDDSPVLADTAGPLSLESGGMYYTGITAPVTVYPDATKFVEDFQIKFGATPQTFAAQAYDAAGICLKAIEEASKAKAGELPTRKDVANAIRALKDYKGVSGTYNFNNKGDPTLAKYYVFKVVSADPGNWGQNTVVSIFEAAPPK